MEQLSDTNVSNDKDVSIQILRKKTRNLISALLNPIKIIPNEKGVPRDWHGLAELCGISGQQIPNLHENSDPTNKVLDLWYQKDRENSTIKTLLRFLGEIDRYDIVDDITPLIEEDLEFHIKNPNGFGNQIDLDLDKYILTNDDVSRLSQGLEPQTYDAFVLFADDDIDFATRLIETVEKEYNFKLCVKDRDLVGGGFEHDSIIKLISERCKRLIVIVSPAFLESSTNKFFYSFAQAIGINQRERKIIPCICKPCEKLPPELSCYFPLDYTRVGKLWDFWKSLSKALESPELTPAPKPAVNRPVPQFHHNQTNNHLQPTVHHEKAKPVHQNHRVKFCSMVNLSTSEIENIIPDSSISPSTSANSLGGFPSNSKKRKSMSKWLKKVFQKNHEVKHKTNEVDTKVKEKKFWSRVVKQKVAVAN